MKKKEVMKKNKLPNIGYKISKFILAPIFKFYYNPKIVNKEYINCDGPIIIVGNHKHIMDQCLVIISTKRVIHYLAKKEYFDSKFAWFFKFTGCIPVNRKIHDKDAKNLALNELENNGAIGLFPEGTRNKTKKILLPFKYGAVSMAKKTNATIIPFAITGDYKFRSKNLTITYGKPFKIGDIELEEANNKLYKIIEDLLKKKSI